MRAIALTLLGVVALTACSKPREVKRLAQPVEAPAAADPTPPAASAVPPEPSSGQGTAQRRRYRVLALGESITDQRVGGGGYLRHLARACPMSRFEHFGRGGDMVNQMRRRFEQEYPPLRGQYDTLIVYGGVNDLYSDLTAGRTNELIEADLSAIYQAAKDQGLTVVAITVSPWGGFRRYFNEQRSRSTRLLNSWILGTAPSGQTDAVVDSYGILSCGDPERLCPKYETNSHDGLHPGPEGHALLGQALLERAFPDCE
jgi:lysophospholipase L1-like esterase